ncbi:ATP-binding protein [Sulfurimonas sp.]|nr:ATP-binding protein [Sulfurimonas sp.]
MSLRYYFIIVFGLGTVFFLFIMSYLLFNRMESIMLNQVHDNFQKDSKYKIEQINQKFFNLNKSFYDKTSLPMFSSMRFHKLTLNKAALKNDIRQLELYFYNILNIDDKLIKISYINEKASEVFVVEKNQIKSNLTDKSYDKNIMKLINLKDKDKDIEQTLEYDNGNIISMTWWVPVFITSNKQQGIMSFSIDFKVLSDSIINMFMTSNETICISDENGKVLITNSTRNECNIANKSLWSVHDNLKINNLNLEVYVKTNADNFTMEINYLRKFIFFNVLPIISIVSIIFLVIFSNGIITTIDKLVRYVKVIASGGSLDDLELDIKRSDELGILAVEVQKSAQEIEKHRRNLESTNKDLESYSYTLAHDLRSPLRSITSFSQILEMDCKDKLNEEELGFLNRIVASTKRMSHLIDDILELARLSNRDIMVKELNLTALANDVLNNLIETNNIENVDIDIQEGLSIEGDYQLFKLILENLFGNALKYSSKKSHIIISLTKTIVDGIDTYEVKDNGVGFDIQYVDKLFKPFQRLHKSDDYEGTGIGLASVKRMIERHGGSIWIDSIENEGTTIYFNLWNKI